MGHGCFETLTIVQFERFEKLPFGSFETLILNVLQLLVTWML
jgi:hypothetical protein